MSRIGREEILAMIPHGGAMCLLDEVLDWDAASLRCVSHRFLAQDNPLRRADGTLGAACGIEIAAQAMAVHGRLTAPADRPPVPGFLVSLRDVRLSRAVLEAGPLIISATRLLGDARGARYAFSVAAQGAEMLNGHATVMFGAPL
jgi:predicted hotdog family 3-hydroxylacyl-ACP dehydratase